MKLGIVGVGNLGGALAETLLAAGFCRDDMTLVARREGLSAARCNQLGMVPQDFEALKSLDVVVLAVKPQDAAEVCLQVRPHLAGNAVLLSMMAGVSCSLIADRAGHHAVARAMPTLGAVVGQSATVFYGSDACSSVQMSFVERVVKSCGEGYRVDQEELLDVATAVAGSGPAYLCWLGEQIELVAVSGGFSTADAHAIVLQTFKGAVAYLEHGGETFSELRSRVTSPNGTTAAALHVLTESHSGEHVRSAVQAALARSRALGQIAKNGGDN
jgi:pyrroline-5-carboxylate reductase